MFFVTAMLCDVLIAWCAVISEVCGVTRYVSVSSDKGLICPSNHTWQQRVCVCLGTPLSAGAAAI